MSCDPALHGAVKVAARHHFVDDAERQRFARRDPATGEQDAHRRPERDLSLQQRHAAVERQPAHARLGQAEARVIAGDNDVAAEHHLEAATQAQIH